MSFIFASRWLALAILIGFSAYTIYASRTESFWKSCRTVLRLKWGRQVVADLYIGLLLFCFFVYLIEGSALVALAWLVPALILGNAVTLIYFIFNFGAILHFFM